MEDFRLGGAAQSARKKRPASMFTRLHPASQMPETGLRSQFRAFSTQKPAKNGTQLYPKPAPEKFIDVTNPNMTPF
jgi:hypothetical protein